MQELALQQVQAQVQVQELVPEQVQESEQAQAQEQELALEQVQESVLVRVQVQALASVLEPAQVQGLAQERALV